MAYKKIQFKRGTKTGMPVLRSGEPGFTQDEKSLYIGDGTANQRFLNEVQVGTKIDEKIAPVTQSITNNVAALNESIASNITTVNQAITDKAKINGEATNVNFIRNDVVKDGLVYENIKGFEGTQETQSVNTGIIFDKNKDYTIFGSFIAKNPMVGATNNRSIFGTTSAYQVKGWNVEIGGVNQLNTIGIITNKTGNEYSTRSTKKYEYGVPTHVVLQYSNGIFKIITQGECITHHQQFEVTGNIVLGDTTQSACISGQNYNFLIYNRQLTPQEIQHNFNVLNNTPSINRINDYAISTDTDHITTPTGVTDEERYTQLLKTMCKEFTSDGSPIVVNGIAKQKVLSGIIEGQTIKNYLGTENKTYIIKGYSERTLFTNFIKGESSKTYKLKYEIIKNTSTSPVVVKTAINGDAYETSQQTIEVGKTGVVETTMLYMDILASTISMFTMGGEIEIRNICIVESSDTQKVNGYLTLGLNSTQAIITANNLKYSFYLNNEDKLAGKVIELGGIGGVYDTFEIKEDGSGIYTQNTKEQKTVIATTIAKGTNNCVIVCEQMYAKPDATHEGRLIKSNNFNTGLGLASSWDSIASRGYCTSNYTGVVWFIVDNTINDVAKANKYLSDNNVTIRYQLATPIVTTIPKELVPTILTQLQNQFAFGEGVAPYSATIQAPVNKIADLETRLAQLEAVVTSTSNLSLMANYVDDEYNNSLNQM